METGEGTGGAFGNEEFRSFVLGIIAVPLSFPLHFSRRGKRRDERSSTFSRLANQLPASRVCVGGERLGLGVGLVLVLAHRLKR